MIIAWRALSASGRATSQSPLTQASVARPPQWFSPTPQPVRITAWPGTKRGSRLSHLPKNPRHHRELTDDFAFAGDRQGIFIVETRPVDGDPHVAFGKGGQVDRFDGGHGAVVDLVQN
jgi:hypothetical protein